jgi:hypothetical protein
VIRPCTPADLDRLKQIHQHSGLPPNCFPDLTNPLVCVKLCAENGRGITQAGFIKLTGEAYVLVDHEVGEPKERWTTLQELTAAVLSEASIRGLDDVTAWIPPSLEKAFGQRLIDLGWIKSPWPSYSALLR